MNCANFCRRAHPPLRKHSKNCPRKMLQREKVPVWHARTGVELLSLNGHGRVYRLAWSPDGGRFLTGTDGKALVWDAQTGEEVLSLKCPEQTVSQAAWSPDGRRILTATSPDGKAKLWDAQT